MGKEKQKYISRRQFAQRAAVLSAGASFVPAGLISCPSARETEAEQLPDNFPKLSPEGQAEAEARYQLVLSRHGNRLTEEQKKNARQLCILAQPGLNRLRAFSLLNGDVPALFLKPIVEREKVMASKFDTGSKATPPQ